MVAAPPMLIHPGAVDSCGLRGFSRPDAPLPAVPPPGPLGMKKERRSPRRPFPVKICENSRPPSRRPCPLSLDIPGFSHVLPSCPALSRLSQLSCLFTVVIDTKSGLAQIRAKVLIDATGDADLIYRAGGGYTMGDNGTIQNPTAMFRLGGVDTARFSDYWGPDTISPDCVTDLLHEANRQGWHLPRVKVWVFPTPRPGELLMNTTLLTGRDGRALNVCNPEDHTEAEIVGRRQVQEYARFFREQIPGCEHSFINDCSPEVGVRQTRSIRGIARLTNDDVAHARKRSDGICRCPWPIELHAGETPYLFWLINDYYEVPYGSLVPETGEHLLVAGRNLCAEHQALASCRVTAQCFEYGHAAALAADLSIRRDLPLRELSGAEIRARMNENGARLD